MAYPLDVAEPIEPPIRSDRYTIPRAIVARLTAEEYVRNFWWLVLPFPIAGVFMVMTGLPGLRALAMLGLAWPLSIPARSVLVTMKSGRAFEKGVWVSVEPDTIYFHGESGGLKLSLQSVRRLMNRHGYYILQLRRLEFVPIPVEAFPSEDARASFEAMVNQANDLRLAE